MQSNKNVLVVGGAGYVGSHTTLTLIDAGYNPIVYDNFSTGHREHAFGDNVIHGELSDVGKLVDTIRSCNIGCVIHFAASTEAGQSVISPLPFYQNNVAATLKLLEAMLLTDVKKIVFSSTAAVYGQQDADRLLSEAMPTKPINPYGQSKLMIESVLHSLAQANGFQAIALRYFNACGADAKKRTGEKHHPETHLIPLVIEAARNIRPNINIYGTDYDTPDGTCVRDYIHVTDLAKGHLAALNYITQQENAVFKAFNLGTGNGHSVREIIEIVKQISGNEFTVHEKKRRAGDPKSLVADASAANVELEWMPENSRIDQIIQTAWDYAVDHL